LSQAGQTVHRMRSKGYMGRGPGPYSSTGLARDSVEEVLETYGLEFLAFQGVNIMFKYEKGTPEGPGTLHLVHNNDFPGSYHRAEFARKYVCSTVEGAENYAFGDPRVVDCGS